MSIISKPVELPLIALDRLWTSVDPGPAHPALGLGDFWVAEENRARVAEAISDELTKQGLGTLESPAPELVETLRLIATATEEYYAWVNGIPTSYAGAVLVSGKGDEAVLSVRNQNAIRLEAVSAEQLAERFVDTFNPVDAADIPALSVPKSEFPTEPQAEQPADDDEFNFTYESDQEDVDPAVKLRELMQAKRDAIYQMYTARRSSGPQRKRVGPYATIDIVDEGRVLTFVTEEGAEPMIQCLPGSKSNLVKVLTEAQEALG